MQCEEEVEFREVKVFINPKVSLPSAETWEESEGYLSTPAIHGDVERPRKSQSNILI
jgi:peptide deformylase